MYKIHKKFVFVFVIALSVIGILSAQANHTDNVSLIVESPIIDFEQKAVQKATVKFDNTNEFNPDYVCINVNDPKLTEANVLPLGQFCYQPSRGFYVSGDRFWQNGAKLLTDQSNLSGNENQKIFTFAWYYPTITNLKTTTLNNNITAFFYNSQNNNYGKIDSGNNEFALANLPPYFSTVTTTKNIEPTKEANFKVVLKSSSPQDIDRVILAMNRGKENMFGQIEWREGKNFFLTGNATTTGNQYISSIANSKISYTSDSAILEFKLQYKENTPISENISVDLHFQSNSFTTTGLSDTNTLDNYSSGWKTNIAQFNLVPVGEGDTPPDNGDGVTQLANLLDQYCAISIVTLDCSKFVKNITTYTPEAGGKTIYVAPGSATNLTGNGTQADPYNTLAQAQKAANSGDVVIVNSGTYKNCISYQDCYELILDVPNVKWIAPNGANIEPSTAVTDSKKRGINITESGIVLDGFTLQNFTAGGLVISNGSKTLKDILIKNTKINLTTDATAVPDGVGMYTNNDGLSLINVEINNGNQGVTCAGTCNNLYLEGVKINNKNFGTGNSGADAIGIENGENIIIANTEILFAEADGIDLKAINTLVINSKVTGAKRNGIKLWDNGDIVNSLVANTGADSSVVFSRGNMYRIANSAIINHKTDGYLMTVNYNNQNIKPNITFVNSVFSNNPKGIFFPAGTILTLQNNLMNPGTINNAIFELGSYAITGASSLSDLSAIPTVSASGNLNFNTNPNFTDLNNLNLNLNAISPLKDAGFKYPNLPATDLAGNPRTNGSSIDIGPLEY